MLFLEVLGLPEGAVSQGLTVSLAYSGYADRRPILIRKVVVSERTRGIEPRGRG